MKVRIRKPRPDGRQLKTGVITVENEHGTYYRLACEGCDTPLKHRNPPLTGQDTFCRECQNIADIGKPDTKLVRAKWGGIDYETPCDKCGIIEQTSFLPKRTRDFLCNSCLKESRSPSPSSQDPKGAPENLTELQPESKTTHQNSYSQERKPAVQDPEKKFYVKCSKCRDSVVLKFQPNSKKPFLCSKCFHKQQEDYRSEKPETRILFNIECNDCGKQETLNFIPTFPERALCSSCFKKMQRSKNDSNR